MTSLAPYRVQLDLTGFSSNTFLEGWAMTQRNIQTLNGKLADALLAGFSSITGSISSEDDNSKGDQKIYIAVHAVVYAASENKAIAHALTHMVEPVLAALPPRGGFGIDGQADCLDSGLATKEDVAALLLALSRKMQYYVPTCELP